LSPSSAIAAILVVWLAPGTPAQPRPAVTDSSLTAAARALSAGDTDRAFALSTNYLKRHPASAQAKVLLVRIHIERGEWDAAYRVASRAARAHPADVEVLYHLGLVTRRLASDEFQRLNEKAPDSARAHQLRAEMLEAQQLRDEAEKEYAAAIGAQPDLLDALLGLAKLKRVRLECEEAVQLYDRAESIRPTFDGAYGLGVCHSYLENHAEAAKRFAGAVERNPSAAVAWTGLGSSLVKLRRTAEGIAKLQRAIALEPAMYEAHYALGMAYQAAGDTVRAQNAFKKAEQLLGPR